MLGYFLKGCRLLFAGSIISSLIVTFINVIIPQVISFTIDSVIDRVPPEGLYASFASLFGGVAMGAGLALPFIVGDYGALTYELTAVQLTEK